MKRGYMQDLEELTDELGPGYLLTNQNANNNAAGQDKLLIGEFAENSCHISESTLEDLRTLSYEPRHQADSYFSPAVSFSQILPSFSYAQSTLKVASNIHTSRTSLRNGGRPALLEVNQNTGITGMF